MNRVADGLNRGVWHSHWSSRPALTEFTPENALAQVGRTVFGTPISSEDLKYLVGRYRRELGQKATDNALDLGCGNGFITRLMAQKTRSMIGIDFSNVLLADAKRHSRASRMIYLKRNVLDFPKRELLRFKFDVAWSFEVVQNLGHSELRSLVVELFRSPTFRTLVLGGVPELRRAQNFFFDKDALHALRQSPSKWEPIIGRWWTQDEIRSIAISAGARARFWTLRPSLHSSSYRMEVTLQKVSPNER